MYVSIGPLTAPANYILVCAPSGCGLTRATEKLLTAIGTDGVSHQDLERILLGSNETHKKLQAKGFLGPTPGMFEVTWYLARSEVTSLWKEAAEQALLN